MNYGNNGPCNLIKTKETLVKVGKGCWGDKVWHKIDEPFWILVAELYLTRTTRIVVERVLPRLMKEYQGYRDLSLADPDYIWELTKETGLKKRAEALVTISKMLCETRGVPRNREALRKIPFIGDYIADAVLLYGYGWPVLPLDKNVQRLIHRNFFGNNNFSNKVSPYSDEGVKQATIKLTEHMSSIDVKMLHQGILYVAWFNCKGVLCCDGCPIFTYCMLKSDELREEYLGVHK